MAEQQANLTEEQASEWIREHFQAANKYLAEQGIIPDKILTKDSRYLVPFVGVWKFTTQDKKTIWVINGDLPTDMVGESAAPDAREALRYFAMRWQLKSEGILADTNSSQEQRDYANYLVKCAENLYGVFEQESLWQQA